MNNFACSNCEAKIDLESNFCEECRAEILKCGICFTPFQRDSTAYLCPYCRSLFHVQHLNRWYEIHEFCPHCKKIIDLSEFIRLPISSFREYRFDLDRDGQIDPSLLSSMVFQKEFWQSQKLILEKFEQKISTVEKKFYVVSPPGSGKTIVGLEIAKQLGTNTLILTPNFSTQEQWIDKIKLFLDDDSKIINTMIGSTDPKARSPITVMTYQRFSVYSRDEEILIHLAEQLWKKEEKLDNKFIKTLKNENYREYETIITEYIRKARHAIIKGELSFSKIEIKDILHNNTLEIVETLKSKGIGLVILDECHHLTSIWAYIVNFLIEEFNIPFVVGLTATPPLDLPRNEEKGIYEIIFGEVDIEIPTPAAVKQKNVSPYQDLMYFTYPLEEEVKELEKKFRILHNYFSKSKFSLIKTPKEFIAEEFTKNRFDILKYYKNEELYKKIQFIFDNNKQLNNELFSLNEIFILLHSYYCNYLKNQIKKMSKTELNFYEKLGSFFDKYETKEEFLKGRDYTFDILNASKAKINAVSDILSAEYSNLKENLRATVIYDFITEELSFELLRTISLREETSDLDPILISSSRIFVDKDIAEKIVEESSKWKKRFKFDIKLRTQSTDHKQIVQILGEGRDWRTGVYTLLFTFLFEKGITKCLIGPRTVLGEGWDSIKLNTLIDLTTTSAYQTVIQTKGRAYRIDESDPKKISNIWDIAVIEPFFPFGLSTFYNIQRKHEHFYGLSEDGVIEKGVGHIFPSISEDIYEIGKDFKNFNQIMLKKAQQRDKCFNQWKIGEEYQNLELLAYNLKFEDRLFNIPIIRDSYAVDDSTVKERKFYRKGSIVLEKKRFVNLLNNIFQSLFILNDYLEQKKRKNENLALLTKNLNKSVLSKRTGNYIRLILPSVDPNLDSMLDSIFNISNARFIHSICERIVDREKLFLKPFNSSKNNFIPLLYLNFPFLKIEELRYLNVIWNRIVSIGFIVREDIEKISEMQKMIIQANKKTIWK